MDVGIVAGFGEVIGRELMDEIAAFGIRAVRQEIKPQMDEGYVRQLIAEFVGAPLRPLLLLGGGAMENVSRSPISPAQYEALTSHVVHLAFTLGLDADGYDLEIGNEPDISPSYRDKSWMFASACRLSFAAAREGGFAGRFITGGVSNLNRRGLAYLGAAVRAGLPPDVVVGFHRYPEGMEPFTPHGGFEARDGQEGRDVEWGALLAASADRARACTEVGHHTALRPGGRVDDILAGRHYQFDLQFFAERGVVATYVYQLNDGPSEHYADRFGLRARDGRWKPQAAAVRQWIEEHHS